MGEVAEKVYHFIKIMAMLSHFSHIFRAVVAVDHWHLGITNLTLSCASSFSITPGTFVCPVQGLATPKASVDAQHSSRHPPAVALGISGS